MHYHWDCSSCVVIYCQQHRSAPGVFLQPQRRTLQVSEFEEISEPKIAEDLSQHLALNERGEDDLDLIITKVVGNFGAEEDDDVQFVCEIVRDLQPANEAVELVADWDAREEQQECEQQECQQQENEPRDYGEQQADSCSKSESFICSVCTKTFETKKLFNDHVRYHRSMQCQEELCSWRGPMKKFNRHLRKSHKINTNRGIKLARGRAGLKTRGKFP